MPQETETQSELRRRAIELANMGDKELDQLLEIDDKMQVANEFFRLAEECDIDCTAPRSIVDNVRKANEALKRTFLADVIRRRQTAE